MNSFIYVPTSISDMIDMILVDKMANEGQVRGNPNDAIRTGVRNKRNRPYELTLETKAFWKFYEISSLLSCNKKEELDGRGKDSLQARPASGVLSQPLRYNGHRRSLVLISVAACSHNTPELFIHGSGFHLRWKPTQHNAGDCARKVTQLREWHVSGANLIRSRHVNDIPRASRENNEPRR